MNVNVETNVVSDDLTIPAELRRDGKAAKDGKAKEAVQVKEDFPAGEAVTVH